MAGLIGLAGLGYFALRNDAETLRQASQENLYWNAAQLEIEYHRFTTALGGVAAGAEGFSAGQVRQRFDVLSSHVDRFIGGAGAEKLLAYDRTGGAIRRLQAELIGFAPQIETLANEDADRIRRMLAVFQPLADDIRVLAAQVGSGEDESVSGIRERLKQGAAMTAIFSSVALIIGAIVIAMLYLESRKSRRMAEENARSAAIADAANRSKSRFLTMMSHELRTPMNGVLGVLALAKQAGMPAPQLRLVEQAEKSGGQMVAMLGDILDYSDLEADQLDVEHKVFETASLSGAVHDLFAPLALRENITFKAYCETDAPVFVVGDFRRLRQALAHFAAYIVDKASVRDVSLALSYDDGQLISTFSFMHVDPAETGWRPDVFLGEADTNYEEFATDALGPAVARGLIAKMGGRINLTIEDIGRTHVRVSTPATRLRSGPAQVRLDVNSESMRVMCAAVLESTGAELAEPDALDIDLALIEVGGEDGGIDPVQLRRRHPRAKLVALGDPNNPEAYDAVARTPIQPAELRKAIGRSRVGMVGG